ncbi:MAG: transposase [Chroococcidiopsidaceae cyanobacterium CP_BM_RX_35]|nr:transposase [Chroococcidiopsidaceae cyanobacterium CP_BM_RX_35]
MEAAAEKKGWRCQRTRHQQRGCPEPESKQAKQADLEWLIWAGSAREICLKLLDESGFSQWSPVSYSSAKVGSQKVLERTKKRGRRLSVLGLLERGISFEYGLKLGSLQRESYLKLMEWQAKEAAERLETTGQITVIVQDNHPIHVSQQVREYWHNWQEKGLYLFQLPKYSSQMNLIETEWRQLKTHELTGRMFEDEYDLALAVITGVEARAERDDYRVERFIFNSA